MLRCQQAHQVSPQFKTIHKVDLELVCIKTDAYSLADPNADGAYYKATANDQYSIWGGYAKDIDHDGNDENEHNEEVMGVQGGIGDVAPIHDDDEEDNDIENITNLPILSPEA